MKINTLKNKLVVTGLSLAALLGASGIVSAQGRGPIRGQQNQVWQQKQKVDNQRARLDQERARLEQQRLEQQRIEQQRQAAAQRQNQMRRYQLMRNGRQYNLDNRQADLLKQAVNMGYQQGFNAGQSDRGGRRGGVYSNSSMYRSGNFGYQSYVDSGLYQDYFRQGFQRGYEDGYNSRHQYGSFSNGGGVNILGTILQGILNLR